MPSTPAYVHAVPYFFEILKCCDIMVCIDDIQNHIQK